MDACLGKRVLHFRFVELARNPMGTFCNLPHYCGSATVFTALKMISAPASDIYTADNGK